MAQVRYDAAPGANKIDVTLNSDATDIGGSLVRLIIDDTPTGFTPAVTKSDVLKALENIRSNIVENVWPPA